MFKEVNFRQLIEKINQLDYVNVPGAILSFKFRITQKGKSREFWAMIDDDEQVLITRSDELNEPELVMEPDMMELYDTIRRVSLFLNCIDDTKYEIDFN